jgi:hypothetical protein
MSDDAIREAAERLRQYLKPGERFEAIDLNGIWPLQDREDVATILNALPELLSAREPAGGEAALQEAIDFEQKRADTIGELYRDLQARADGWLKAAEERRRGGRVMEERIAAIIQHARETGQKLTLHHCSFCAYPVGWQFIDGALFYDNGCDCVHEGYRPVPESHLVDSLTRNQHILIARFESQVGIAS